MENFKNKIVWITGASSGTGEALTYAFDNEGAKLIISARRGAELERVRKNCSRPEDIFVLPLDLEKHDSLEQIAKQAISKYGYIDLLFNNGGISQRSLAADTSADVDIRLMDINYLGTVIITKAVLPYMIERKTGHIAVMTSLSGKFGVPYRTAYSASKHALHGFFDALRAELYKDNIKITLTVPGFIKTGIAENAFNNKGNAYKKTDPDIENGMLPEVFAQKAIKAIKKEKNELILGGKEKLGVYLKRFVPGLFAKILRNQL